MQKIKEKEKIYLAELQTYKVVKSNELIQQSRFNLSLAEQRIILYMISMIKPNDTQFKKCELEIIEFCKICGLSRDSGGNYKNIKSTVKTLADKSIWITVNDANEEKEILLRWINTAIINKKSGIITLTLSSTLEPYLLHLKKKFTQYELYYTIAMSSTYSIRIYEILKSYQNLGQCVFEIDDLKKMLFVNEKYKLFADFKRYVIDAAVQEINKLTDLNISYELAKESRKFTKITFSVCVKKDLNERLEAWKNIEHLLGLSLNYESMI